jgi:hypothetical protein
VLALKREALVAERLHSRTAGRQEALDEAAAQEEEPEVEQDSDDDANDDIEADEQQMYRDDSDSAGSDDDGNATGQEEQDAEAAIGQPGYVFQGLTAEQAEHMQGFLQQLLYATRLATEYKGMLTIGAQHAEYALAAHRVPRAARNADMDAQFRQWHSEVSSFFVQCTTQALHMCSALFVCVATAGHAADAELCLINALQVREDMQDVCSDMRLSSKASKVLQEAAYAYKQQVDTAILHASNTRCCHRFLLLVLLLCVCSVLLAVIRRCACSATRSHS